MCLPFPDIRVGIAEEQQLCAQGRQAELRGCLALIQDRELFWGPREDPAEPLYPALFPVQLKHHKSEDVVHPGDLCVSDNEPTEDRLPGLFGSLHPMGDHKSVLWIGGGATSKQDENYSEKTKEDRKRGERKEWTLVVTKPQVMPALWKKPKADAVIAAVTECKLPTEGKGGSETQALCPRPPESPNLRLPAPPRGQEDGKGHRFGSTRDFEAAGTAQLKTLGREDSELL
ncbi:hypothetical protein H920_15849 [Fukomys damarensis]|uniref:Uncharacterized protein n=1 Tax=Fukomys damarensis TaxID=885580 RepID=A0A091DJ21_FUKDA|nr:hypothetical protein H920_15849 [Fukomys damarensis]